MLASGKLHDQERRRKTGPLLVDDHVRLQLQNNNSHSVTMPVARERAST